MAITLRVRGPEVLGRRAHRFAVATALVGIPLVAGQALAYRDYVVTRDVRAQTIIDALEAFYSREEMYPDALAELVAARDLDEIPTPRIGFDFFYDKGFVYSSFGTSYLLEFIAPRWAQCAYNPPWEDEEEEGADFVDESLDEAWSCPSQPPELW